MPGLRNGEQATAGPAVLARGLPRRSGSLVAVGGIDRGPWQRLGIAERTAPCLHPGSRIRTPRRSPVFSSTPSPFASSTSF
jgi:hypothetical protein